jgi:guanylate kinase
LELQDELFDHNFLEYENYDEDYYGIKLEWNEQEENILNKLLQLDYLTYLLSEKFRL